MRTEDTIGPFEFPDGYPYPMSTVSRLAFLFIAVPLLELFILIQVGEAVGLWPTIGLVVLTGFLGATLARLEGLRVLLRLRGDLAQGRLPGEALMDGFGVLLGGILLLTPGILTDLLGFAFLIPPTRRWLVKGIRERLERRLEHGAIRVTGFGRSPWDGPTPSEWGEGQGPSGGGSRGGSAPGVPRSPPRPGEIIIDPEDDSNRS